MNNYLFSVVRLENHDYAKRLEELFSLDVGTEMKIHLEPDNEMENDAVMVVYGAELVGYVRSGEHRQQAAKMLKAMGHPLTCKIVETNRSYKKLTIEVITEIKAKGSDYAVLDELEEMQYDGELLRQDGAVTKLKAVLDGLIDDVENEHEWNQQMENSLRFVAENLWRDPTRETQTQAFCLENMLKVSSEKKEGYNEAANRMEYIITNASSSSRDRRAIWLSERGCCDETRRLIDSIGIERAMDAVERIPTSLTCIYDRSPQEYAGKVWYMRLSNDKLRQLETLMAMRIALNRKEMKTEEVLIGGDVTLRLLKNVMCVYDSGSPKELAIIYCALRDNDLLVNRYDYLRFVDLLDAKRLLPPMNAKEKKELATNIGKHMKARIDHKKLRKGFGNDYHTWDDGIEKETCIEIAKMMLQG